MPRPFDEVAREAAELPATERLKLARMLLDLSETEVESAEVQAAWDVEIERRLEELKSGKVQGIPLEEVKRKVEGRFSS